MAIRFTYDESSLSRLPKREARSNKGTFGQVVIAGGSPGMSGAAYFSAKAAYRTGCGMCRIVSPEENRVIYQTQLPEAVLSVYDWQSPDEKTVKNAVCRASALVIGVGLGIFDTSRAILKYALESANAPTVIDADGLNLLAANRDMWKYVPKGSIVTPHPLEMSRLTGLPLCEILENIPALAEKFALEHSVICVLKDSRTAVSDGNLTMINRSGNSALATAGSGDVLSGIIASLLAQGMSPFDAASCGVYIHGLAGEYASKKLSEYSVIASDITDAIPDVMKLAEKLLKKN